MEEKGLMRVTKWDCLKTINVLPECSSRGGTRLCIYDTYPAPEPHGTLVDLIWHGICPCLPGPRGNSPASWIRKKCWQAGGCKKPRAMGRCGSVALRPTSFITADSPVRMRRNQGLRILHLSPCDKPLDNVFGGCSDEDGQPLEITHGARRAS